MNEKIYKHKSEYIKASLTWLYAANFGTDSYIGQNHRHCLRTFNHEILYTSAFYELK